MRQPQLQALGEVACRPRMCSSAGAKQASASVERHEPAISMHACTLMAARRPMCMWWVSRGSRPSSCGWRKAGATRHGGPAATSCTWRCPPRWLQGVHSGASCAARREGLCARPRRHCMQKQMQRRREPASPATAPPPARSNPPLTAPPAVEAAPSGDLGVTTGRGAAEAVQCAGWQSEGVRSSSLTGTAVGQEVQHKRRRAADLSLAACPALSQGSG